MNGFVLSDLHLFTNRSSAQEISAAMHDQLSAADFLVLNGDIFDFEWTHLASIEQAMAEAIQWLLDLLTRHPHCTLYYILGNHDAFQPFIRQINTMAETKTNLHLCPTHLVLGHNLFFHGDLPLARKNPWHRIPDQHLSKKRALLHNGYDWAILLRLHTLVYSFFTPAWCAKRIVTVLNKYPSDFLNKIDTIYFGHTHLPFTDYSHDRFSFVNTGAAISGVNVNMTKVTT